MKTIDPPISAVLFDLDDTLNDRPASWRAFVPRFQQTFTARLGNCDAEMIEHAIAAADQGGYRDKQAFFGELCQALPWKMAPSASDLEKFWRNCFAECMVEREGAARLLADLRRHGLRLAIITNGRTDMQRAKIAHLQFDSLADAIVISEEAGVKKPDRRIFEIALNLIGCSPVAALMVGDHPVLDVTGARNAGMRSAWLKLDRDWPAGTEPPEVIISSLNELRPPLGLTE